jgi:hypothetical protein
MKMKKTLFATAMLMMGFAASAAPAEARVNIYLGVPHYDYRVGPDYRFRDGYGWYRPGYAPVRARLSCGEARRIVRRSGYRDVVARNCSGRTYSFEVRRGGRYGVVFVNSRTGQIWRG